MDAAILVLSIMLIVCLLLGLLFLVLGKFLMRKFNNLKKSCSKYTTAKVIDIVSESYGYSPGFERPMIMNFPILEFMFNDKMVTKKYMYTSSKKEQYEIGKEYKIYYNPDDENMFYIDGDKTPTKVGKIFIGVSSILLVLFIVFLVSLIIYVSK